MRAIINGTRVVSSANTPKGAPRGRGMEVSGHTSMGKTDKPMKQGAPPEKAQTRMKGMSKGNPAKRGM